MLATLPRRIKEIAPLLHAARYVAIAGYIGITHTGYWGNVPLGFAIGKPAGGGFGCLIFGDSLINTSNNNNCLNNLIAEKPHERL
jgi:hypothetical protein